MSSQTYSSVSTAQPAFSYKQNHIGYKTVQDFLSNAVFSLGAPHFTNEKDNEDEYTSDTESDYAESIISYRPETESSNSQEERFYRIF